MRDFRARRSTGLDDNGQARRAREREGQQRRQSPTSLAASQQAPGAWAGQQGAQRGGEAELAAAHERPRVMGERLRHRSRRRAGRWRGARGTPRTRARGPLADGGASRGLDANTQPTVGSRDGRTGLPGPRPRRRPSARGYRRARAPGLAESSSESRVAPAGGVASTRPPPPLNTANCGRGQDHCMATTVVGVAALGQSSRPAHDSRSHPDRADRSLVQERVRAAGHHRRDRQRPDARPAGLVVNDPGRPVRDLPGRVEQLRRSTRCWTRRPIASTRSSTPARCRPDRSASRSPTSSGSC